MTKKKKEGCESIKSALGRIFQEDNKEKERDWLGTVKDGRRREGERGIGRGKGYL